MLASLIHLRFILCLRALVYYFPPQRDAQTQDETEGTDLVEL